MLTLMDRIADFGRAITEAAIELQYIAADYPRLASGLLPLAAMLEKTAQLAPLAEERSESRR
jgi:hypothetical protein